MEGAFYVGSLADGSVHRIDRATGRESVVFTETAPGTWWTLGMHVDATRRRLFVCAMDDQRESGADGMAFDAEGRLRVAFTSQLTTLEGVTAAWQSARASSVDVPSGMTDVVIAGDAIHLLNGQAVRFALGDAPDPFALARLLSP